jgi:leader peptidase (prepilin peptidase) / N-methyltransferase
MLETAWIQVGLIGLLGLLVGSFLNVVIHRMPKILQAQWAAECAELNGTEEQKEMPVFNLMVPRSRCGQCGHAITWYENIPILSYLVLRGKCSSCGASIGCRASDWAAFLILRYPVGLEYDYFCLVCVLRVDRGFGRH